MQSVKQWLNLNPLVPVHVLLFFFFCCCLWCCHLFVSTNHHKFMSQSCPDVFLPHPVILKPESSGRSQTAPSPSLCLSPSWRGPSGKSSSLRLSTKNKQEHKHCTVWPLSLAFRLPTSPGSFPGHQKGLPPPVILLFPSLSVASSPIITFFPHLPALSAPVSQI